MPRPWKLSYKSSLSCSGKPNSEDRTWRKDVSRASKEGWIADVGAVVTKDMLQVAIESHAAESEETLLEGEGDEHKDEEADDEVDE